MKTYDLDDAATGLPPLLGPETVIITLQNGIDAAERVARVVGADHVLAGVTYVNATRDAPGMIRHSGGDRLVFGELRGGSSQRTQPILEAFKQAGIVAEVHAEIGLVLWQKFAVVCATGGVMAFSRQSLGPVLADPGSHSVMRDTVAEVVDVGRAGGVALADDYSEQVMALLAGYPPSAKSSMLVDLEAGRRLELDAITGTAMRLGREWGVPTPRNDMIYAALQPYANGAPPEQQL